MGRLPATLKKRYVPLVEAAVVGNVAGRTYEWYPTLYGVPTAQAGKLKEVRDTDGVVLAAFEYDGKGRLTKRTRGVGLSEQTPGDIQLR